MKWSKTKISKNINFLLIVLLLLVSIPVTIFLTSEKQDIVSHAAPETQIKLILANNDPIYENTRFTVYAHINTNTNYISAADLIINFDQTKVSSTADDINPGSFLTNPKNAEGPAVDNGEIVYGLYQPAGTPMTTGQGIVAMIDFQAVSAGDTVISFDESFTKIVGKSSPEDLNFINVVNSFESLEVDIQPEPEEPTNTPTPTPKGSSSNTDPECIALDVQPSEEITTNQDVAFTCYGVDQSGYISAAEFEFGDGERKTIYKNVGSPGSLSITYKYTKAGTFGASCKIRDNKNVYSSVPDGCRKSIKVTNPQGGTGGTDFNYAPSPSATVTKAPEKGFDQSSNEFLSPAAHRTPSPRPTRRPDISTFDDSGLNSTSQDGDDKLDVPFATIFKAIGIVLLLGVLVFLGKKIFVDKPPIPPTDIPLAD